jgi:hypothetical protein
MFGAASDAPSTSWASLPFEAQVAISTALAQNIPAYQAKANVTGFAMTNQVQDITADFRKGGVEIGLGNLRWKMRALAYGYADALRVARSVAPQGKLNRIEYRRGLLTKWYVNGPLGLEQGFKLAAQPGNAKGERLTVALGLSGNLKAALDAGGTSLSLTNSSGAVRTLTGPTPRSRNSKLKSDPRNCCGRRGYRKKIC